MGSALDGPFTPWITDAVPNPLIYQIIGDSGIFTLGIVSGNCEFIYLFICREGINMHDPSAHTKFRLIRIIHAIQFWIRHRQNGNCPLFLLFRISTNLKSSLPGDLNTLCIRHYITLVETMFFVLILCPDIVNLSLPCKICTRCTIHTRLLWVKDMLIKHCWYEARAYKSHINLGDSLKWSRVIHQYPFLLAWFNFNHNMDK